jgi:hypothetical protein
MNDITKKGGKGNIKGVRRMMSFSDRSGLPYLYREMIYEPDTEVWLHPSESDGNNNRIALAKRKTVFMDAKTPEKPSKAAPEDITLIDQSWPDSFY